MQVSYYNTKEMGTFKHKLFPIFETLGLKYNLYKLKLMLNILYKSYNLSIRISLLSQKLLLIHYPAGHVSE